MKKRLADKTSLKPSLDLKETLFLWHCTIQLTKIRLFLTRAYNTTCYICFSSDLVACTLGGTAFYVGGYVM